MDIGQAFVKEIADIAKESVPKIETKEIDGKTFTINPNLRHVDPPADPRVKPLIVRTLSGLVEYVKSNLDAINQTEHAEGEPPFVVHVIDEKTVQVITGYDGADYYQRRTVFCSAEMFERSAHPFGSYMDQEKFVIWLQTAFADAGDRAGVLKVIGNLADSTNVQTEDDGVTQKVTIRTGVVREGNVDAPNPVSLAPFRTFVEAGQPLSKFVLRIKNTGQGALMALHLADGDEWRTEAVQKIAEYLRGELPDGTTVIA